MIIKKWVVLVLVIAFITGLTGCLETDSSKSTYDGIPSYITSDAGKSTLQNNVIKDVSQVYVPKLDTLTNKLSGDYVVASFSIDYDNQSAGGGYYTADLFGLWESPMTVMSVVTGELTKLSDDTIINASPYALDLLHDKMFVIVEESAPEGRVYEYHLIWNTDSTKTVEDKTKEILTEYPAVYLNASILSVSDTGRVVKSQTFRTFDMNPLINSTFVKTESGNDGDYRTVQFYLYYQTGKDRDGRIKYTASAKNPWKIRQAISPSL